MSSDSSKSKSHFKMLFYAGCQLIKELHYNFFSIGYKKNEFTGITEHIVSMTRDYSDSL
jgi:hypothetical protein